MLDGYDLLIQFISDSLIDIRHPQNELHQRSLVFNRNISCHRIEVDKWEMSLIRNGGIGMAALPTMIGIALRITVPSDLVSFFRWKSSNTESEKRDGERDGLFAANIWRMSSRFPSFGAGRPPGNLYSGR